MRPPFIRVIPAEAERYGAAAAIVLAHIRYRGKSDGPGRVCDEDGTRWWRVSPRCGCFAEQKRSRRPFQPNASWTANPSIINPI